MRVYIIVDWLKQVLEYIVENPDQSRCDNLRKKTAELMAYYSQTDSGNQRSLNKVMTFVGLSKGLVQLISRIVPLTFLFIIL